MTSPSEKNFKIQHTSKSIEVLNECYKVKHLNLKLEPVCNTEHKFVNLSDTRSEDTQADN